MSETAQQQLKQPERPTGADVQRAQQQVRDFMARVVLDIELRKWCVQQAVAHLSHPGYAPNFEAPIYKANVRDLEADILQPGFVVPEGLNPVPIFGLIGLSEQILAFVTAPAAERQDTIAPVS